MSVKEQLYAATLEWLKQRGAQDAVGVSSIDVVADEAYGSCYASIEITYQVSTGRLLTYSMDDSLNDFLDALDGV